MAFPREPYLSAADASITTPFLTQSHCQSIVAGCGVGGIDKICIKTLRQCIFSIRLKQSIDCSHLSCTVHSILDYYEVCLFHMTCRTNQPAVLLSLPPSIHLSLSVSLGLSVSLSLNISLHLSLPFSFVPCFSLFLPPSLFIYTIYVALSLSHSICYSLPPFLCLSILLSFKKNLSFAFSLTLSPFLPLSLPPSLSLSLNYFCKEITGGCMCCSVMTNTYFL